MLTMKVGHLVCALATAVTVAGLTASPALGATPSQALTGHVVIVGIPGLQWSDVSAQATPALYGLAQRGSAGTLVEYAVLPLTCPADGWLTLNGGARAEAKHDEKGPCPAPAVDPATGTVPGMAGIIAYNNTLSYQPTWGALSSGGCSLAAGPGGALALADSAGQVDDYAANPSSLTAADLAKCPLSAIDLGALPEGPPTLRAAAVRADDTELARIESLLPAGAMLMVASPGSLQKSQLGVVVVSGPGYTAGILDAKSTRQPGMVVITDLTPSVLRWLGRPVPTGMNGTELTSSGRDSSLADTIRGFTGRATAERVWTDSHSWFFWTYALADVAALAGVGLCFWGATEARRRQRARWWRVAAVFAAAVPLATFLPNLVSWWLYAHPAAWLYGMAVAWTAVIGAGALAGPWRRTPWGPFGFICLLTVLILGVDVMTGSQLQLETPFGLSVLEAGRFYGIGNEALGIYGISALGAAAWLGLWALQRGRSRPWSGRQSALVLMCVVAGFAVIASGWPGFGAKVGGTIAMVPCFLWLFFAYFGIRLNWRRAALVAVSGLGLFIVFALVNYWFPFTGTSDIGSFTGNVLHGHGGGLLSRKVSSNIGSLTVNAYSPVAPLTLVVAALMLWRPAWFRLRTVPLAYAAEPLLAVVLGAMWLMPVLGWFADDSGVIVPATALPFGLPLGIGLLMATAYQGGKARYVDTAPPAPVAGKRG
jgi:hypothetical protein